MPDLLRTAADPGSTLSEGSPGGFPDHDVAVIGGGVAGLSVAWRTARRGLSVVVVDPSPGSGATHASAGMLAPVSEVTYTEQPLLRLGLASLAMWPAFRDDLEGESGEDLDYRTDGTLDVAYGTDDMAYLDDLGSFEESLGLRVERLTGRQCRALEPMLSPSVRGGLLARDDAWVNPRRVISALLTALAKAGGTVVAERADGLAFDGGRVVGVRLASGQVVGATSVVVAAGPWSPSFVPGLPVRPVKGQILRLRGPEGFLTRCVRGLVHGAPAYLVPRGDGEITVGATMEEMGFDGRVTAGGVYELLRDARELVPGVTELELSETTVGFRPGTPDNLPLIGPLMGVQPDGPATPEAGRPPAATPRPGEPAVPPEQGRGARPPDLLAATGHHRAGVLLAPITADAVAAFLTGEPVPEAVQSCDPGRFGR
ncbi:glycine oxidase ThiO [Planotetraspora phitsanulokensis]|uniref:glycine oxidase n=1 Tax=Planotetraspora phitsanulokensis TaxID=575192 RepID=A0A8J3U1N8_9ACTN|nr:glycine oxidase ThiO [Planotetraspora phitsanulokensis]GII35307.1 glycine oxidase ThiO [Planotetraspora phitsanulokensis]